MNESPDWPSWLGGTAAALGLVWAFFKRFFATVTREELAAMQEQMHRESLSRFDQLNESVTGVHQRMDDLYRDLIKQ